jgi:hypothetical protein
MAKNNRTIDTRFLQDPNGIKAVEYNPASGGQKSLIVGPKFLPIPIVTAGTPGWKTNITAATAMPYRGAILAIYNNAATAGSVTIGQDATVTSQAIGASDANGNVGIACAPNSYTYVSMGYDQWIVGSAATLFCYIMEHPTKIAQETGPFIQQNVPGFNPPINS